MAIHWQVLIDCWSAPAMLVLKHIENIFYLVYLVLSLIISWTFRILAHEEDRYNYVYKIFSQMFVSSTQIDQSRASKFENSFSSLLEYTLNLKFTKYQAINQLVKIII